MSLIDLRDRVDDPGVAELVGLAHGSAASLAEAVDRYRTRTWMLLGWEENDELAGCIGVERNANGLQIRSLAVASAYRKRGVGRALIEALVDVATDTRSLTAETDAVGVGFYQRCGFDVNQIQAKGGRVRYRCERRIEVRRAPAQAVAAVTLGDLERAVRASWSRETSEDPEDWTDTNPATGHCGVTALLVRELLGGEILVAGVIRAGRRVDRHAWNKLPSGLAVDLTREQFRNGESFEEPRVGDPLVVLRHPDRYAVFAGRVREALGLTKI